MLRQSIFFTRHMVAFATNNINRKVDHRICSFKFISSSFCKLKQSKSQGKTHAAMEIKLASFEQISLRDHKETQWFKFQ